MESQLRHLAVEVQNRHQACLVAIKSLAHSLSPLEPVGVLTASPIILNPITLCLPKYLKKRRGLCGEQLCLVFVLVERGGLELSCSFPMQKYVVCWP